MIVVLLDQVADAERDDFIRVLTNDLSNVKDKEAHWWAQAWIRKASEMPELKQLEGYDDMLAGLMESLEPEQRLAGLDPEQVLKHYDPEQRLAGLDPEQILELYDPEQRLAGLAPEQRLAGLDPEQRLAGLDSEQLKQLRAAVDKKLNK